MNSQNGKNEIGKLLCGQMALIKAECLKKKPKKETSDVQTKSN